MRWRGGSAVAAALLIVFGSSSMAAAEAPVAATLTVLAEPAERIAAGGRGAEPGVTGMDLAEGDRIKTGRDGIALITFLNGSTVTVLPDSEITVRQAVTERGNSAIRLLIHAGRVWARVVKAAGSRSIVTLESNEYSATAHDGLIGAEQGPAGFVCWTRRGSLRLTDRSGVTEAVLAPGQRARARLGVAVTPEPFVAGSSVLEIRSSGPVVPLVRMPDGRRSAGFLAEDVEVNHVFGSLTEGGDRRWLVEVPGGYPGPYTLVLTGTGSGSFTVRVSGRYAGFSMYRQELKGDVREGERLYTRISQSVKGDEPQTARVLEATMESLRPWDGHEPPAVVASPGDRRRRGSN